MCSQLHQLTPVIKSVVLIAVFQNANRKQVYIVHVAMVTPIKKIAQPCYYVSVMLNVFSLDHYNTSDVFFLLQECSILCSGGWPQGLLRNGSKMARCCGRT